MMKEIPLEVYEEAARHLDYDPVTGFFHWRLTATRTKSWNVKYAGKRAGTINSRQKGPLTSRVIGISIRSKVYRISEHRLAWFMVHGKVAAEVFHIDRDGTNNSISNLKSLPSQSHNWRRSDQSIFGVGVHYDEEKKKYRVHIGHEHVGYYDTAEVAAAHSMKARIDRYVRTR